MSLKNKFRDKIYGASHSIFQPEAIFLYLTLSCSLFTPPCQNSNTSGIRRYPPQYSGIGTLSLYIFMYLLNRLIISSLPEMTELWFEAHAPRRLFNGRVL